MSKEKKYIAITILCVLLLIFSFQNTVAENSAENKNNNIVETNIKKLKNFDFNEKYSAMMYFDKLNIEAIDIKIKPMLINVIEKEMNDHVEMMGFARKGIHAKDRPERLKYLNTESYGLYRVHLKNILSRLASRGNRDIFPYVMNCCLDPNLLVFFGEEAIDALLLHIKEKKNAHWAVTVISKILEMDELYSPTEKTREIIKKTFIKASKSKDKYLRRSAAIGLGVIGDIDLIPLLEKMAKKDPEINWVGKAAKMSIAKIKHSENGKYFALVKPMLQGLQDLNEKRAKRIGYIRGLDRNRNTMTLAQINEVIKALTKIALEDKDNDVRIHATKVLGNIGNKQLIPILKKISTEDTFKSKDSDKYLVREAALEAIKKISKNTDKHN